MAVGHKRAVQQDNEYMVHGTALSAVAQSTKLLTYCKLNTWGGGKAFASDGGLLGSNCR